MARSTYDPRHLQRILNSSLASIPRLPHYSLCHASRVNTKTLHSLLWCAALKSDLRYACLCLTVSTCSRDRGHNCSQLMCSCFFRAISYPYALTSQQMLGLCARNLLHDYTTIASRRNDSQTTRGQALTNEPASCLEDVLGFYNSPKDKIEGYAV